MRTKLTFFILLVAALAAGAGAAESSTRLVPDEFPSIQAAVDTAVAGDTILVAEGVYEENVRMDKPLTLKSTGSPGKTTVIAADRAAPTLSVTGASGFEVSGLTLTGSASAGLTVRNSHDGRVSGNRAIGNENGILIYGSNDNIIEGNSGDSNALYGIYLERSHDNHVEKNTASRNRDRGIFLSYSNGNSIVDNDVNLNTWNGITLWESDENVIRENLTLRNTYGIVIGHSKGNVVEGNTSLPNVYIILPAVLLYLGILTYLLQRTILRMIYGK